MVDAEEVPKKSFERDKAPPEGNCLVCTSTPLENDLAALRKLRDDDASGALKKYFGDGEDPRKWSLGTAVTVAGGREAQLAGCTSLAALPDDRQAQGATTLTLYGCSVSPRYPTRSVSSERGPDSTSGCSSPSPYQSRSAASTR